MRRIQHPWRVLAVVALVICAVVSAFALGQFTARPDRDAILAAQNPIPVLGEVETRIVDDSIVFAGTVQAGEALTLHAGGASTPPVVVRRTLSAGDQLMLGAMVGIVSGSPFFVLPEPLPLYRDLLRGDSGDDVVALQQSLGAAGLDIEVTGEIDGQTIDAVEVLFERNDLEFDRAAPIRSNQFLPVPSVAATVVDSANVGDHLGDDVPLLTIRVQPTHVVFRADAVSGAEIATGATVTIRTPEMEFTGTVQSVGEFAKGEDGEPPGREVIVVSDDAELQATTTSTAVTVLVGEPSEPGLAVPITAVRTEAAGDNVLVKRGAGKTSFEKVPIQVTASGGGWAAIAAGELEAGDRVKVSE